MLFPDPDSDPNFVYSILKIVYWPIYGDFAFRSDILENQQSTSALVFAYISMAIFVCIVNILLLNLLIALFT
jgi:hypothetical protein